MKINVNKFNHEQVVDGIVIVAQKKFDKVNVTEKTYEDRKVAWIRIGASNFKSEFEITVETYLNGEYKQQATWYSSRPYGDGSKYGAGFYGKVLYNPEDGNHYRTFIKKEGEKSIKVTYTGGERFKSSNMFYKLFNKFWTALYNLAWETGGFSVDDPYEKAQEYYEWGSTNGWFDQLLYEIKKWKKELKKGNVQWLRYYISPIYALVTYKGARFYWTKKGLISVDI